MNLDKPKYVFIVYCEDHRRLVMGVHSSNKSAMSHINGMIESRKKYPKFQTVELYMPDDATKALAKNKNHHDYFCHITFSTSVIHQFGNKMLAENIFIERRLVVSDTPKKV